MLMGGGLTGWTGLTPEIYARMSYRQIFDLLFAERDKDGHVVPEAVLLARARGEKTGLVSEAPREMPTKESLGIPDEAFRYGNSNGRCVPRRFVLAWFQTALMYVSIEEAMIRWRKHTARYGQKPIGAPR